MKRAELQFTSDISDTSSVSQLSNQKPNLNLKSSPLSISSHIPKSVLKSSPTPISELDSIHMTISSTLDSLSDSSSEDTQHNIFISTLKIDTNTNPIPKIKIDTASVVESKLESKSEVKIESKLELEHKTNPKIKVNTNADTIYLRYKQDVLLIPKFIYIKKYLTKEETNKAIDDERKRIINAINNSNDNKKSNALAITRGYYLPDYDDVGSYVIDYVLNPNYIKHNIVDSVGDDSNNDKITISAASLNINSSLGSKNLEPAEYSNCLTQAQQFFQNLFHSCNFTCYPTFSYHSY